MDDYKVYNPDCSWAVKPTSYIGDTGVLHDIVSKKLLAALDERSYECPPGAEKWFDAGREKEHDYIRGMTGRVCDIEDLVPTAEILDEWAARVSFDPRETCVRQAAWILIDKYGNQAIVGVEMCRDDESPNGRRWEYRGIYYDSDSGSWCVHYPSEEQFFGTEFMREHITNAQEAKRWVPWPPNIYIEPGAHETTEMIRVEFSELDQALTQVWQMEYPEIVVDEYRRMEQMGAWAERDSARLVWVSHKPGLEGEHTHFDMENLYEKTVDKTEYPGFEGWLWDMERSETFCKEVGIVKPQSVGATIPERKPPVADAPKVGEDTRMAAKSASAQVKQAQQIEKTPKEVR